MEKKLLTQIKNEWRSNLWLATELLLVSVVMWYVTDYLYTRLATYLEPRGFDIEHCYLIEMGELTNKSADYIADKTGEQTSADVQELAERIRRRPEVEAVSLSQNSYPYNGSNSTASVEYDTLRSPGWTIRRLVSPDFVRVFRYRGAQGETSEQLAEMLSRDEFLASNNLYQKYNIPMTSLVGKGFYIFGDTTRTVRLGAALQDVRYHDFAQARSSFCMLYNLLDLDRRSPGWVHTSSELCVRVKADQDRDFIARLKADSEKQLRVGNVYISEVRSFADIRRNFEQNNINNLRNYLMGMGFLMLNIFLGLLGTFWFRTQQRRGEIALHKVMGATSLSVFSRLLSEGMLLLTLVTIPALIIDYNLARLELNSWRNDTTLEPDRLLLCAGISFVLIALMIAIGIGIPARKAMKVQPAEALHDE
ncbi:MAG: ABC transporter permease [Bacteroides sp.]|nr:ABC transporter permease [Bacteroides sp.]